MKLSGLLPPIRGLPETQALLHALERSEKAGTVVIESAKAALIAVMAEKQGSCVLIVTSTPDKALKVKEELAYWLSNERALSAFPEREPMPYERLLPDRESVRERLLTLERLLGRADGPLVVVASVRALAQRTLTVEEMAEATISLAVGEEAEPDKLLARLAGMGYEIVPLVEEPGQTSRRGGILDVFAPTAERPVRIEMLGRRVESMRPFDPTDQRSSGRLESATFGPAREMLLPSEEARRLREAVDLSSSEPKTKAHYEEELSNLADGVTFPTLDLYVPFLAKGSFFDHLLDDALLILDEPAEIRSHLDEMAEQAKEFHDDLTERGELPEGMPEPHMPAPEVLERIEGFGRTLTVSRWASGPESGEMPFGVPQAYGGRLRTLATEIAEAEKQGQRIVMVSQQAERLAALAKEQGIEVERVEGVGEPPKADRLAIVRGSVSGGWRLGADGNVALTLLTDSEIFGFTKQRRSQPRQRLNRDAFLSQLSKGDYVVHIDHGIARFAGLIRRSFEDRETEYLELHYAEGDKLFVPTDQLDRVSRYVGPGDHTPALTRLSSQEWARTKERVRRATAELARELLDLYATREMLRGHASSPDTPWQQELEASFPYVETPDQIVTIRDVKADMERPQPMDRLICGDVGYGKTEIAIRAAFKAVMDERQVAVLVPTTVLAQQHGRTFGERLAGFPIRVEVLSRFKSDEEQRRVIEELAQGNVDIIIGTHRLLQKDVQFKNLGLLIIDEEQRFGVAHKEHLKKMRTDVDVLTLSATPIPRTLYMALGSIRDVSTMETPPEERLPIKTYVSESDDRLIREAVMREMERGGQVYFVHNRVQGIEHIAERLRRIVPEASFTVAHGQMPEHQLEAAMLEFSEGTTDVLVCTTIIESGLDIPNVNTIIINQANRLGLAQLYQLRGRVGRGAERAYAYLLYDRNARLTDTAQKRLQTIFEATELGAGFQIAMRDLEIRGAGNLLGAEQSGRMAAVGLDLYTRLLAEQVERMRALRSGKMPKPALAPPASITLPIAAYIPEDYIGDLNQRLAVYQRLAGLTAVEQVNEIEKELQDRFGKAPELVLNLLYVAALRILAQQAGVESIGTEGEQLVIRANEKKELPREKLRRELAGKATVGRTQLRFDFRAGDDRWKGRLYEVLQAVAEAGKAAA